MKTLLKRCLVIFLVVVMVCNTLPLMAFAANEIEITVPEDAVEFNGHYYKYFPLGMSWDNAKAYCESLGGYLATVTSAEEDAFLYAYINSLGINLPYYDNVIPAYFGLYEYNNVEGDWRWITEEPVTYLNWNSGEPNGGSSERYGMYYNKNGKWNDGGPRTVYASSDSCNFICEWGDYYFSQEPLIERVRQYTYHGYNLEQLATWAENHDMNLPDNQNYFAQSLNALTNSIKESKDYTALTNRQLYCAYWMTEELKKPSSRAIFGLGGLVFNSEASGYLEGKWAEKDKYKDALKKYVQVTHDDFETLAFIKGTVGFLGDLSAVVGDAAMRAKIQELEIATYHCTARKHVETLLYKFDFTRMTTDDDSIKRFYKDGNKLKEIFGLIGDGISIVDITGQGICNLMSASANLEVYSLYADFFAEIAQNTSFPCALRTAAQEMSAGIAGQYVQAVKEIGSLVAGFVESKALSLSTTKFGSSALGSGVLLGLSIGSFIGNIVLGVDEYIKAAAYIECYEMLAEYYEKKLQVSRAEFIIDETLENAQKFRDRYITLWNLRVLAEETYRDMIRFDTIWIPPVRYLMQRVKGYDENKAFIQKNIDNLRSYEFTMVNDLSFKNIQLKKFYEREIVIACPVDIVVYENETNTIIGKITDNTVDAAYHDNTDLPLVLYTQGESKHVKVPQGADYRIEIIATDSGTMHISNSAIDGKLEVLSRANYYDIPLRKASRFVINDKDGTIDYDSIYAGDTLLKPDEMITSNTVNKHQVVLALESGENGTAYGGGTYTKGEYASLYAIPSEGYAFAGWYENDQRISSRPQYGFVLTENKTLRAEFAVLNTAIAGYQASRTLRYKTTIWFHYSADNLPQGATVHWFINEKDAGTDETYKAVKVKSDFTVQCKVIAEDGETVLAESEVEKITVKKNFFQKVRAFFLEIFGLLDFIDQK